MNRDQELKIGHVKGYTRRVVELVCSCLVTLYRIGLFATNLNIIYDIVQTVVIVGRNCDQNCRKTSPNLPCRNE